MPFEEWLAAGDPNPEQVLAFMFSKGTLRWVGRGDGKLEPLFGDRTPVPVQASVLEGLEQCKLIERMSRSCMSERYYQWQLSDDGLGLLGKPTRREMGRMEHVGGADVRKVKKRR